MKKVKINFADFWEGKGILDEKNPFNRLLSKRFELMISDEPDFLVYSCFGAEFLRYKCIRIFYTGENVRPDYRMCDYSFSFDYPTNEKNYRWPIFRFLDDDIFDGLRVEKDAEKILQRKSKFCAFVYSNADAKERIKFFERLNQYKPVDSGGAVLNNIGYRVENLIEFLKPYKFYIAFENTSYPGYTTEKIVYPFASNAVPIYWGNPVIHRDFNTKSFINCHDYKNFDEVIEKIIEMGRNDALYKNYVSQPCFRNNEMPAELDVDRILDRFEQIFDDPTKVPVAQTWKAPYTNLRYRFWRSIKHRMPRILRHFFYSKLRAIYGRMKYRQRVG